jgi:hypothetical protein
MMTFSTYPGSKNINCLLYSDDVQLRFFFEALTTDSTAHGMYYDAGMIFPQPEAETKLESLEQMCFK